MNDLQKFFENNTDGRLIYKWLHYFDIYDRHFSRFRNKEVNILEIGVFHGGSLQMWKSYFGEKAQIFAIDIEPVCEICEEERIKIFIGSQEDRNFLKELKSSLPKIDILIDDGGHTMSQQITTFEEMYSHISPDGIYLCEDLHTSYWPEYGGGYKNPGSFIEFSKTLIDKLHTWHLPETVPLEIDNFTLSTYSMHYYDSILVIEKKPKTPPVAQQIGKTLDEFYQTQSE